MLVMRQLLVQGGLALQRTKPHDPETWKCSLWPVDNPARTFVAVRSLHKPEQGGFRVQDNE